MHSMKIEYQTKSYIYGESTVQLTAFHHGDFSGAIQFFAPKAATNGFGAPILEVVDREDTLEVRVPFEALKAVVAEKLRQDRIAALESASDDEILEGLK